MARRTPSGRGLASAVPGALQDGTSVALTRSLAEWVPSATGQGWEWEPQVGEAAEQPQVAAGCGTLIGEI